MFSWAENSSAIYLLHIWAGFFFLVIFPIYSWDHIRNHIKRLKDISILTVSGIVQLITGVGLIISGIPLLIFGSEVFNFLEIIHFFLTFVLPVSLILHKFSRK
tara:strand:+ start:1510 stop:1818 length:309 start_codon:yes stop_codon:yes gene_type:complete